ncbi:MAG: hypothetical protein JO368_13310 [Acidimicrobiales bacterium]|nr:hypothetical protein [Acidimicrobiales bacterium]
MGALLASVLIVAAFWWPSFLGSPPASAASTRPTIVPKGCQRSPAADIAALPAGATWVGQGCYNLTGSEILITKPVTIDGGTFYDNSADRDIQPLIRIKWTDHVTVENVTLVGSNNPFCNPFPGCMYHSDLVNGAGIDVLNSSDLVFQNIVTMDTWGDGMTLFGLPRHGQDTNILINGLTVVTAGRCGFAPTTVANLVVQHLHVESSATPAIDFESDLPTTGITGPVSIANSTWVGGLFYQEFGTPLYGPDVVTFTNDLAIGTLHVGGVGVQLVQFIGGGFQVPSQVHGVYVAAIEDGVSSQTNPGHGLPLVFNGVTFTRTPDGPVTAPGWAADNGSRVVFNESLVPPPVGTADPSSRVWVNP